VERFDSFIGFQRCVGFNGFGVFFGSFEFFNGFVARFDGFIRVGFDLLDLLNSFFANLIFNGFVGSSFC
jgi:hypothetical protein